jgi:predicted PurR-regulated permease PerM
LLSAATTARESFVPRVISFLVLLAIVLLVGVVFFQVMAHFIVPLFLAGVLLVIFQPLHRWILNRIPRAPRTAAFVTTILIILAVLLPLVWLGWNAYVELRGLRVPTENSTAQASDQSEIHRKHADSENEEAKEDFALRKRIMIIAQHLRDDLKNATGLTVDDDSLDGMVGTGQSFLTSKLLSGVQSAIGILIGLAIMVIALYYFLADGPVMIDTMMELSPLDYRYEEELLERFSSVSRAVVVATLFTAFIQGTLAGIGYYFALPSGTPIFLLTALTMVFSLVPFVGAAAVWVIVCLWLYQFAPHVVDGQAANGNPTAAIALAIYCAIMVSGIDHLIKPLILHGQSKLHPLLALLSIVGGIEVLGPVGILVGPMLVSFLQALLIMLRKELDSFGGPVGPNSKPLAESVVEAVQQVTDDKSEPRTLPARAAKATPAPRKAGRAGRSKRKR